MPVLPTRYAASLFLILFLFALHPRPAAQSLYYLDVPQSEDVTSQSRTDEDGLVRIDWVGRPYLRTFHPEQPPRGVVVICPGGGYGYLSMTKEGDRIAQWLAENGFVGMVLGYRLPHEGQMEGGVPLSQRDGLAGLRRARRFMDSLGLDERKLVIMGFSAGGHLAASLVQLADADLRPDASVLVYPVISMRRGITHGGSRTKLIGAGAEEALIARYSNDENVTDDFPPTLLVHSTDDRVVPVENSLRYYDALRNQGVPAALLVLERGGHGFGLRPDLEWTAATLAWLSRQGF